VSEFLSSKKISRLEKSVRCHRKNLYKLRENRISLVDQYVGKYFGEHGAGDKVPINMLEMAANIWQSQLAARTPQVLVSTKFRELMASASDFSRGLNHLIEHEIKLGQTLAQGVLEAMFSPFGVVKVGLCRNGSVEIDGYLHDYGQPYADVVDLDDVILDLSARRWDLITFAGDKYRVPLEFVKESGLYQNVDDLSADDRDQYDDDGQERARDLSSTNRSPDEEWEDMIDLVDIWLPRQNVILTFKWNGDWKEPLREIEWDGPEGGPYHYLSFVPVPGQILGNPPLGLLRDLHEIANQLYMSIVRSADMSKDVIGYRGEAAKDAERLRDAANGELIRMDDPQGVKPMHVGAIDQQIFGLVQHAVGEFEKQGGNLQLLGGLSPQSETATQDKLLSANASRRMAHMQSQVMDWTKGIIQSLAFYLWEDPIQTMPLTRQIPNTNMNVTYSWGPEHREGDFLQYNFDLVPYSMVQHTPQQKLQEVMNLVQTVLVPMGPMLQQQGKTLDLGVLLEMVGRYGDLESELQNLIIDLAPSNAFPQEKPMGQPRQSPVTTRTQVRVNRSGGSEQGKRQDQVTQLMGGRVSPQQRMAAAR
jgi:hypothetical protein